MALSANGCNTCVQRIPYDVTRTYHIAIPPTDFSRNGSCVAGDNSCYISDASDVSSARDDSTSRYTAHDANAEHCGHRDHCGGCHGAGLLLTCRPEKSSNSSTALVAKSKLTASDLSNTIYWKPDILFPIKKENNLLKKNRILKQSEVHMVFFIFVPYNTIKYNRIGEKSLWEVIFLSLHIFWDNTIL